MDAEATQAPASNVNRHKAANAPAMGGVDERGAPSGVLGIGVRAGFKKEPHRRRLAVEAAPVKWHPILTQPKAQSARALGHWPPAPM